MSVLVLGATGNVGPHVVSGLIALGDRPRVMVRDAARARSMFGADVEVVAGDVRDPSALGSAIDGVDSVFLLSPHSFAMADLQLGVIRSLRRTGIRIVKLSGTDSAITADGPYACREHWEIERILKDSGQPFVILRPNSFMQVLVGRLMMSALRATGTVVNPIGTAGISLIDARDVGAVAPECSRATTGTGRPSSSPAHARSVTPRSPSSSSARTGTPADRRRRHPRPDVRASLIARGMAEVGGRPLRGDVRTVPRRRVGVRHRHRRSEVTGRRRARSRRSSTRLSRQQDVSA